MTSPTQRTLAWLRQGGHRHVAVVEKWIPQTKRRIDLFGFIDIVALDGQPGLLGVQATSGANTASRRTKILTERRDAAEAWLRAGNRILVIGWRKLKPRGVKVARWHPKLEYLTLAELPAPSHPPGTAW